MLTFEMALKDIKLDPDNARKHDKRNLDAIKASLEKFGQQKPIVVDGRDVVLAGNGTLMAAKDLKWETLKVVRSALKGHDATAYAIADNRATDLSEWEDKILDMQLTVLNEQNYDLSAIGFLDTPLPSIDDLPPDDAPVEKVKPRENAPGHTRPPTR